jgi:hypothetical protein
MDTVFYYQLTSRVNEDLFYIGYTTNCDAILIKHKSLLESDNDIYLYRKLREVGGGFTFTIIKEELYDNKDDMREEKRRLCLEMRPTLNGHYVGNMEKRENNVSKQLKELRRDNDTSQKDWARKITIYLNDLKKNPQRERGGMIVSREYITEKGMKLRHNLIIYNDEMRLTDRPTFPLKDTNGIEIM